MLIQLIDELVYRMTHYAIKHLVNKTVLKWYVRALFLKQKNLSISAHQLIEFQI